MSFGAKLRVLREEKRWTQKQVSAELGISQSLITDYENNAKMPRPDTLIKIAKVFKVSIDYMLGLVEERDGIYSGEDVKEKLTTTYPFLDGFDLLNSPLTKDQMDILASMFKGVYTQVVNKLIAEGKLNPGDKDIS